jgi:ElaB/YqjD/DUF883 family membrane-anchored ribosome-binding protein
MEKFSEYQTPIGTVCVGDRVLYDFGTGPITLDVTSIVSEGSEVVFRGNWSDGDDLSHISAKTESILGIYSMMREQQVEEPATKVEQSFEEIFQTLKTAQKNFAVAQQQLFEAEDAYERATRCEEVGYNLSKQT